MAGHDGVAEHYRDDGVLAGEQVEAFLGHAVPEELGVGEELAAQFAGVFHEVQGLERGRDDGRGQRVGEQVGAGLLAEHRHDLAAAGDVAAGGAAEGLAEGAGVDVHAVRDAGMFRRAAAAGAHEADGVGIVHHDQGVVLVGQVADRFERGQVAVHGEDAVGDDDLAAGGVLRVVASISFASRSAMSWLA